jgi:peptidoglycan/LPS O-acetylase OafA/YrhL
MRALAALAVLVFHVFVFVPHAGHFDRFAAAGRLGVYLFFTLTGYLLFVPFARRFFGDGRKLDLGRYARNRALRILPLYWAVLAILLVVAHGGGEAHEWLKFGTLTQSFFVDTVQNDVDEPMWSLAVEVQFYVLLPLLAFVLSRLTRSRTAAAGAIVACGLVSVFIWYRKVYLPDGDDPRWRLSLPTTFFAFTPGMLLALVRLEFERRTLPRFVTSSALVVASIACWVAAAYWTRGGPLLAAPASFLLLAAVVLPSPREGALVRVLDLRFLSALGIASYSLYLWHVPLLELIGKHIDVSFAGLLALGLVVCVPVAAISYALIERPFLTFRERWTSTDTRPAPNEPSVPRPVQPVPERRAVG